MADFETSKLYQAIKDKNINDVKELLNKGENPSVRNTDGTTYLHAAVQLGAPVDIFKLLLEKVDISIRGSDGQTVADLISKCNYPDEAEAILNLHIKELIMKGDMDQLEKLCLSGWQIWPVTIEQAKAVSEDLEGFMSKLPEFQAKIKQVHEAVEQEKVRELKNLLDRKKLLEAADKTGLPPFQKAVVLTQMDVVHEMVKDFKNAINFQDGMGRTPFHYAGGKHDGGHMYELLKEAGGDESIKDINGCTPKDYHDDPMKIGVVALKEKLKETLDSAVVTTEEKPETSEKSSGSARSCRRIYVSQDTRPRTGTKPTTIDGKYVAEHLGSALTFALAELAEKRPKDPIEYLSKWLYKYRENMDHNMQQEALIENLKQAEEEKVLEAERKERIKTEQKQLEEEERQRKIKEEEEKKKKEQEELQRKAKEAALAQRPNLETVTEEGEEETPSKEKDSKGQTELHRLAAQEGADMRTLINMGYSIAERDADQRTARDLAEVAGITDNVQAIDNYVRDLLKEENVDELEQLVLEGYDKLESILESITDQSEDLKQFTSSIPDYMKKIQEVFTVVQKGVLRDVQQTLERKKLATARDNMGRCPLHIAVLTENNDVVDYIAKSFPATVKCKDHMNRTPLHYAMGLNNEDLVTLLLANDADTTVKDVLKRTPSDYRDHSDIIKDMKDKLSPPSVQQESDGKDETQQQELSTQQEVQGGETTQQEQQPTQQTVES
ncbi:unnamed protein product [Mytilus coruscus]|uniref:Uncharacterized protein n=1 Tax=Mytilus coruscus TaxID=42192 RepID=A0A6J8CZF4_MYTCO|nr:unnamed protein product [Mytilus coruscus]